LAVVWVCEAVNYRNKMFKKPLNRPEGDRIVVLTDKDGDGKADESTVFYQGPELYGPIGICVLAQPSKEAKGGFAYRVLVCQSPDILEFWDKDGDGKADGPPKKFLTGFRGFDHDHGVHGINVGPDGKLYSPSATRGWMACSHRTARAASGSRTTPTARPDRLALRHGRDEPGADRPQLPQQLRVLRQQFGEIWLSTTTTTATSRRASAT
jgi:Membrane bound L-sorbosone dehydrogenase.